MKTPKLYIAGSATIDNPGILATEAMALRFAQRHMPADLKRAGFTASICTGQEVFNGKYRECFRVNYGKTIPNHKSAK